MTNERNNRRELLEKLLLELNRAQLMNKSKHSDSYVPDNQYLGRNRWERRIHSHIDTKVSQYNKIDMNKLFKDDQLVVGITVHGETADYVVTVRYDGVIKELAQQIKKNNGKIDFKTVVVSLNRVFNADNVYISCTCPDFKYRIAYWATKKGYNSGTPELRPSDITNPGDTKGAGCKHINLILSNIDWIMKVASVINNYIHYMEQYMQRQYADLIFPKLYGMKYDKAVQLNLFDMGDNNNLANDTDTISLSNRYGRNRTKFQKDIQINNAKGNFDQFGRRIPNDKPFIKMAPGQQRLDFDKEAEEDSKPKLKLNVDNKK